MSVNATIYFSVYGRNKNSKFSDLLNITNFLNFLDYLNSPNFLVFPNFFSLNFALQNIKIIDDNVIFRKNKNIKNELN